MISYRSQKSRDSRPLNKMTLKYTRVLFPMSGKDRVSAGLNLWSERMKSPFQARAIAFVSMGCWYR